MNHTWAPNSLSCMLHRQIEASSLEQVWAINRISRLVPKSLRRLIILEAFYTPRWPH
jgi:hypothetical protein